MQLVHIDWRPDAKALRKFGVVVMVGFALIALVFEFLLGDRDAALVFAVLGAGIGLPGLTGTVLGLPGYWLWMGIAFLVGSITSRIAVAALYYGVITPMGLTMRLFRRDKLQLRNDRDSYWTDLPPPADRARYERQF